MSARVLSNPSQLVVRNSEWLSCNKMLMLGMPADGLGRVILQEGIAEEVYGLTRDFSVYRAVKEDWSANSQLTLHYGSVVESTTVRFDGVLVFLQKSKPLMDFWLAMIAPLLKEDAVVWLTGENSEGIKSWRKRLKQNFSEVKNMDNARHCSLIEASGYLHNGVEFSRPDYYSAYELKVRDRFMPLFSLPGVFSHGRVDLGTAVLLDTFDHCTAERVLDFGCGAGVIAGFLGQLNPDGHYTLVDSDALALESSTRTLQENNVRHFNVVASDGLSELTGEFDLVVSNPPFHQGVKTHYAVTEQFLVRSADLLKKGGELRIVANSFLRYEPIIRQAFGDCKTLVVKKGFSIYQAFKR
ncbi:class I SAM-dependent methyltransferase [Endozoicomonas sp. 8E]|uniref:class I SAM-dependent methyltransferase n=1 Tax=Endozoicomonas sp. 8E TaxID=3035692 RepID=UPI00293948D0|nr:class I SAM-dependent methyltransferase [Endozoicomonas sp. 8E]WOG26299.1 class I SAM-dependent methyltransferase [Endozoicomonas sp. 8E]